MEKIKTKITGLTEAEANDLQIKFGKNEINTKKHTSYFKEFFKEFTNVLSVLLIIATVFSYIAGEKIDAVIIFVILIINGLISFVQKFKADKAVEALQKLVAPHALVFRDGIKKEIDASLLVPGDIIFLQEGHRVPADAILLEANMLYVSESILTGESVPVSKEIDQEIFMGTEVVSGEALAKISSIGLNTKFGQIAKLTTETKKSLTPLELELMRIGKFVLYLALAISGIIILLTLIQQKSSLMETLLFASSVAVAAVPEGLPATVTIALAIGVQRLARKGSILKQLSAVETLGCTSVIVTDKTGTLTTNQMTVKELYTGSGKIEFTGNDYNPTGQYNLLEGVISADQIEKIALISTLCNSSTLFQDKENNWKILGDPTEGSLLPMIAKLNKIEAEIREQYEIIQKVPFNSVQKYMTTTVQNISTKESIVLLKGAPDIVQKMCKTYLDGNIQKEFDSETTKKYFADISEMGQKARRTLALAYKNPDDTHYTLVGLVGIYDPPRTEIKGAIAEAKSAGIRIIMATGDHGETALAIGKELNLGKDLKVVTGDEFEKLSETELKNLLSSKQNLIFARVKPEDKLQIVSVLQNLGEVVAVTGDGVNDAPALKKANIGIAMGITGTEVSKEAADMVLSHDNFANIIDAVKEGRGIYENLKKFIFFIFSCNIGEVIIILAALILGLPTPITAILLLTINVGTDLFPALALSLEPAENNIMLNKPRSLSQKILNKKFNLRFILNGLFMGLISIWIYLHYLDSSTHLKAVSVVFATLVTIQLFNALNAKSETNSVFSKSFWNNKNIFYSFVVSGLMVSAVLYLPIANKLMETTPLNYKDWIMILACSSLIIVYEEIRKIIIRKNGHRTT